MTLSLPSSCAIADRSGVVTITLVRLARSYKVARSLGSSLWLSLYPKALL